MARRRSLPLPPLLLLLLTLQGPSNALKLTSLTDYPDVSVFETQQQPHHDGYGVDSSFPSHYGIRSSDFDAEERQMFYDEFMKQCRNKMGRVGYLCDESEKNRMEANLLQPRMMKNYTELGFEKVSTPLKFYETLKEFYKSADKYKEAWDRNNGLHGTPGANAFTTHLNHWQSSSNMINFKTDAGEMLRTFIWDETRSILEKWAGVGLSPSTLYGRSYADQAVVPPHVDSIPFVISVVIRIAQDLVDPWVIEMIGHDGKAYNVSLGEGEMLIYEGASVIHGRPFPMNGVHTSDVFVHFEPIGHYMSQPKETNVYAQDTLEDLYEQALSKAKNAKVTDSQNLASHPSYIVEGSIESKRWMQTHERSKLRFVLDTKNLNAHTAASAGNLEALIAIAEKDPSSIKKVDANGWTPLHEAVRSEQLEILKWLVSQGLDYNLRTHHGDGGSPLWWAKKYHGKDSKVVKFLESKGAIDVPPDGK